MEENKKLRLLVTTVCPNKCPLCCNNSWDFNKLPTVDRYNYEVIMLTGGEPLLFPDKIIDLVSSLRKPNTKIYIYTAVCDVANITMIIKYVDGLVVTPHNLNDIPKFITLNDAMLHNDLFHNKSMRLNLFSNIKEALPKDIDLSMWHIKNMKWIKNCPVPKGEDFRRLETLWTN